MRIGKLGLSVCASLLALAVASPGLAQQFGVGASYGWYNDVENGFHFNDFHSPEWEGWLETKLGEDIVLRLTYGTMRIPGDNVGSLIVIGNSDVVMPSYLDRVQFVSLDVSYLAIQGPLTSGFFAGIGGYGIRPEEVSPELDPYRDQRERVIGLRVGVDGDLHIYRGLSLVGRLTFHAIFTDTNRSLLVTTVGATYRF